MSGEERIQKQRNLVMHPKHEPACRLKVGKIALVMLETIYSNGSMFVDNPRTLMRQKLDCKQNNLFIVHNDIPSRVTTGL